MENHPKIRREIDGKYTIDFIKRINGKRVHIYKKGYNDITSAEKEIDRLIEKRINDIKIHKNGTFAWFFDKYIEFRSHKISGSTLIGIKTIYNVVLKQYEEQDVYDIFSIHNIISLYKNITERKDVGDKWKNRVIMELRGMIDYASILKLIDMNTASDCKTILESVPVNKKSKEKEIYTSNQIKRFIEVIDDEDDKDMFTTFVYLGARISEFLGLTWDCYDAKKKTIEIKQQIVYLQKGKAVLADKLKTKESYRKCRLNNEVYLILEKRKCSKGYIFHNGDPTTAMSKTTFRRKMHKYMKMAKLPIISPHGFRHSKATLFMSVCKNMSEVKAAAKFLGHSVTMMMETYAHSDEKTIDTLIRRME